MSEMSAKADQDNFIVVYPSGTGRLDAMPDMEFRKLLRLRDGEYNIDDVGFLRALIDTLERDYAIDRKRVL